MVNDRYCELTGYSREELLNCTFLDITHPDDRALNQQRFHQLTAGQTNNYEMEKRYLSKDGKVIWVQVSVSFVCSETGEPLYAIAGVQDISERKRKEETLRFLVNLNTAAQQLIEPRDIMAVTARMLGAHLDADRCAYAEVESDQDHFVIFGDYTRNVPSIVGRFSMGSFGAAALRLMRAGEPYIVNDVDSDPQVGLAVPAYRATQIQAVVCVPLHKAGRFAACMAVHQQSARQWTSEEIDLIQLVVARCWESIERARSERDLQESEQRLQFVMDSLPQKIFTSTPTGKTEYVNPQWLAFTGLPFRDIKNGQGTLIHPDDLPENMKAWQHSLETGEPLEYEHRFLRSDGAYRWHITHAAPILDAHGKISMWVGSNTDIHDLKLAHTAASRRSEQVHRLATVAAQLNTTSDIPSILAIVTQEARALLLANLSTMTITSARAGETLTSVSDAEKYSDKKNEKVLSASAILGAPVNATNQPMRLTAAQLKTLPAWKGFATEDLPRGWMAAPLVGKDGTNLGILQLFDKCDDEFTEDDQAVLVQLAQMTSVALENTRLMEGLSEASERKDEFLATLAHELRNPLAPIRNMLEVIKTTSDAELREKAYSTMERQLAHMVRLIDDLLDVSRLSRGKLELRVEQIELTDLVAQIVEVFQPLVEAGKHTLTVELPSQPIYLAGDPARLIQAFGNLIDNACKYSNEGGKILFAAERVGTRVAIQVKDTGIGIPSDKLEGIFDMFEQVDRSLERPVAGLGIGLTLAKRFVEMHDGTITVHSA